MEWSEEGRYETTCPKGHAAVVILQEQQFELLFDIGAYALKDGYYREAVSSFASGLERFYEFFVAVALSEKALDYDVLDKAWKLVSKQSERQLGAFIYIYTSEFNRTPQLLKRKSVEFRNDVIHNGQIPSRQRAAEFGQEVLDLIRPIIQEAKKNYSNGIQAIVSKHLKRSRRTAAEGSSLMTIPTIISLSRDDHAYNNRTLSDAINDLRVGLNSHAHVFRPLRAVERARECWRG
jgi:hypothetical protein